MALAELTTIHIECSARVVIIIPYVRIMIPWDD